MLVCPTSSAEHSPSLRCRPENGRQRLFLSGKVRALPHTFLGRYFGHLRLQIPARLGAPGGLSCLPESEFFNRFAHIYIRSPNRSQLPLNRSRRCGPEQAPSERQLAVNARLMLLLRPRIFALVRP